jgi:hypothetical protein
LTWYFAGSAQWRSGYFKVSGIAVPTCSKACRWVLVGSVSIAMVTLGAGEGARRTDLTELMPEEGWPQWRCWSSSA